MEFYLVLANVKVGRRYPVRLFTNEWEAVKCARECKRGPGKPEEVLLVRFAGGHPVRCRIVDSTGKLIPSPDELADHVPRLVEAATDDHQSERRMTARRSLLSLAGELEVSEDLVEEAKEANDWAKVGKMILAAS
jgi:hypothetical protein